MAHLTMSNLKKWKQNGKWNSANLSMLPEAQPRAGVFRFNFHLIHKDNNNDTKNNQDTNLKKDLKHYLNRYPQN
jgi:hypothetical protein